MSKTSTAGKRSFWRRFWGNFPLVIALTAILVAGVAIYLAQQGAQGAQPMLDTRDGLSTDEAMIILERANDAVNHVGDLLSFLEVALGIIGFLGAVGMWVLRSMILDKIDEMRALEARVEKVAEDRQAQLEALEHSLQEEQTALRAQIDRQLERVAEEGRRAFRLLSLQLLAEQQVRAHNIETAISALNKALDIAPDDPSANYLLGYLYTTRKQIDQAIEHLQRALEREPDFAPAIAALGLALRRKGDGIDVEAEPQRLAERNRYWAQAEERLLEALERDDKLTDADGESYYGTLGGLYRRQGRYADALHAYEQAHEVTPDSSYPVVNLAALYAHQGDTKRARAFFRMVEEKARLTLDDDPRNSWARGDLAQALLVQGKLEQAQQEMQRLIKQKPEINVLETVHNGLQFLAEAPNPPVGIETLVALLEEALRARENEETGNV